MNINLLNQIQYLNLFRILKNQYTKKFFLTLRERGLYKVTPIRAKPVLAAGANRPLHPPKATGFAGERESLFVFSAQVNYTLNPCINIIKLSREAGSFRGCRDIYVLAANTGFARICV